MPEPSLRNCRILLAEDEFMLADELQMELEDAGAVVIGPVGSLSAAIALIEAEQRLDGAVLDANLGGEMVFPAADLLIGRAIPILFTTGYDSSVIPARFSDAPRFEKPINLSRIIQAIHGAIVA